MDGDLKGLSQFSAEAIPGGWIAAAIAIAAVFVCVVWAGKSAYQVQLPPGPRGWPIVGSLGLLRNRLPHEVCTELARKYGPIFYLKMGSFPAIIISSAELAEVVLFKNDRVFSSRYRIAAGDIIGHGQLMTFSNGDGWLRAKSICVKEVLAKACINKAAFQSIRREETMAMVKQIREASQAGRSIVIRDTVNPYAINSFTRILFSKRYFTSIDGTSNEEKEVRDLKFEADALLGCFNLGDFIPLLKPFDLGGFEKRMRKMSADIEKFMGIIIKEKATESATIPAEGKKERSKDFLDTLMAAPSPDGGKHLDDDIIKFLPMELLVAFNDSTVSTIEWCFTELMRHPAVRASLQEELDRVLGPGQIVEEADMQNLKYLEAIVRESLRLHPAAPLQLPHMSTAPCRIGGYKIPAGTNAIVNVHAVGRDPLVWDRPLEFDPSRFMKDSREIVFKNIDMVTFGAGRRSCPGKYLALLTVKLTVATVLHCFDLALPNSMTPADVDLSDKYGVVFMKSEPLEVIATPRLSNLDHLIRTVGQLSV